MIKFLKFKISFLICFLFLFTLPVLAAKIEIESDVQTIEKGIEFEVDFLINTEEQEINALEGKIFFPDQYLEIKEIKEGNSVISFWVEKPFQNKPGEISFSGIIPGGYYGNQGLALSLIFLAQEKGSGSIGIKDLRILANDGQGTEVSSISSSFEFIVFDQSTTIQEKESLPEDNVLPEKFQPRLSQDPDIFDGQWFIVFDTKDKGSGIDYFQVCEGKESCQKAESPYLLKNQKLNQDIIVKAVDKSGNEIVSVIPKQKSFFNDNSYLIFLILVILIYSFVRFLKKEKKIKENKKI